MGIGQLKESVVGQERWEEIRRLRAEGMTVSGIARSCVSGNGSCILYRHLHVATKVRSLIAT